MLNMLTLDLKLIHFTNLSHLSAFVQIIYPTKKNTSNITSVA